MLSMYMYYQHLAGNKTQFHIHLHRRGTLCGNQPPTDPAALTGRGSLWDQALLCPTRSPAAERLLACTRAVRAAPALCCPVMLAEIIRKQAAGG